MLACSFNLLSYPAHHNMKGPVKKKTVQLFQALGRTKAISKAHQW